MVAALAVGVQLVPAVRDNPPALAPGLTYASAPSNVRKVFDDSCQNCHSNQTAWALVQPRGSFFVDRRPRRASRAKAS
jgi:hypothetical protein